MQHGEDLSSCSNLRARGMCHHLRTSLQALVDVLLEHPQACWIPWSAGRGASEKPFWYLRQTKGEFSTLPCSAFPGAREVGEAPPLEIFRTQRDESWSGSGAPEIQHGNVAFPLVRCFCVHESQRLFSLKSVFLGYEWGPGVLSCSVRGTFVLLFFREP